MSKQFEEIATLKNDLGVIAVVTKKEMRNGYQMVSFSIMREFERKPGAPTERTSFLNERHLDGLPELLEQVRDVILREKDESAARRRHA